MAHPNKITRMRAAGAKAAVVSVHRHVAGPSGRKPVVRPHLSARTVLKVGSLGQSGHSAPSVHRGPSVPSVRTVLTGQRVRVVVTRFVVSCAVMRSLTMSIRRSNRSSRCSVLLSSNRISMSVKNGSQPVRARAGITDGAVAVAKAGAGVKVAGTATSQMACLDFPSLHLLRMTSLAISHRVLGRHTLVMINQGQTNPGNHSRDSRCRRHGLSVLSGQNEVCRGQRRSRFVQTGRRTGRRHAIKRRLTDRTRLQATCRRSCAVRPAQSHQPTIKRHNVRGWILAPHSFPEAITI